MVDHSHQSDNEENQEESTSSQESGFLSLEEIQERVEEKFAKYGLTREDVDLVDTALENGETPDVSAEKLQAYHEMNEASSQELRDSLDGFLESIRPKVELPTWQVDNVFAAWSGDLSNTLGKAFTKSLPKFFTQPEFLGPSVLQGYLKDAGFFKNVFSDGIMPRRPGFPTPPVNVFSGFDFTKLSAFVSQPEIGEQLDELIDESDELEEFAEENVDEIEQATNSSPKVAKRISVVLLYVLYFSLHFYMIAGLPFNQVAQMLLAGLTSRGSVDDIRTLFKKDKDNKDGE